MKEVKQVTPIQRCQKLTKSLNTLLHVASEEELSEIDNFLTNQVKMLLKKKQVELDEKHAKQKEQLKELL
jgi:hypothetical protein